MKKFPFELFFLVLLFGAGSFAGWYLSFQPPAFLARQEGAAALSEAIATQLVAKKFSGKIARLPWVERGSNLITPLSDDLADDFYPLFQKKYPLVDLQRSKEILDLIREEGDEFAKKYAKEAPPEGLGKKLDAEFQTKILAKASTMTRLDAVVFGKVSKPDAEGQVDVLITILDTKGESLAAERQPLVTGNNQKAPEDRRDLYRIGAIIADGLATFLMILMVLRLQRMRVEKKERQPRQETLSLMNNIVADFQAAGNPAVEGLQKLKSDLLHLQLRLQSMPTADLAAFDPAALQALAEIMRTYRKAALAGEKTDLAETVPGLRNTILDMTAKLR